MEPQLRSFHVPPDDVWPQSSLPALLGSPPPQPLKLTASRVTVWNIVPADPRSYARSWIPIQGWLNPMLLKTSFSDDVVGTARYAPTVMHACAAFTQDSDAM